MQEQYGFGENRCRKNRTVTPPYPPPAINYPLFRSPADIMLLVSFADSVQRRHGMKQKAFSLVAGLIFLLVAVAHLLRLLLKWSVILDGWTVPMWVSAIALVVAGLLAFEGLRRRP